MRAANYPIKLEQGATFRLPVKWVDETGNPVNLSYISLAMMVRPTKHSENIIISGLFDGPTDSQTGDIVITKESPYLNGIFNILIESSITQQLNFTQGVYDLEASNSASEAFRLLEGPCYLSKEVTRGSGFDLPLPETVAPEYIPYVRERGSGVLSSDLITQATINLNTLCGITSYFSNRGGTGVGHVQEGFWMDVLLDGVLMHAGVNNDYRESTPTGSGAVIIQFNYPLYTGSRITVIVRRL